MRTQGFLGGHARSEAGRGENGGGRLKIGITVVSVAAAVPLILLAGLSGCGPSQDARAGEKQQVQEDAVTVGVSPIVRKPIFRQLTLSSELVPFQEIDVFAKEAGYIKQLLVDYGTRVKAGQVMAVLEMPELEAQIQQDVAAVQSANDQLMHSQN